MFKKPSHATVPLKATEMCGLMSGGPFVSVIEIVLFASIPLAAPFTSYAG